MLNNHSWRCGCVAALALFASIAVADSISDTVLLGTAEPVLDAELVTLRGQAGLDKVLLQMNSGEASAQLRDNVLESGVTGNNSVDRGAFANSAGVIFSVQNTGNHVIIQNSTLINVNLMP